MTRLGENGMKIIHISALPPPVGGKAIFLQRLKYYTDLLSKKEVSYIDVSGIGVKEKEQKGIQCISKIGIVPYLFKEKPAHIVFHSNSTFCLMLNQLFIRKHRFIYFAHGESILKEKNRKGWRHKVLSKAECIVCLNDSVYSEVKQIFPETTIKEIPIFILPNDIQPLNEPSLKQLRKRVDFVFSAYANSLVLHEGVSLYGVDMLIEALYELRNDGYNCGIILLISDASDQKTMHSIKMRIGELNLTDYLTILDHPIDEACRLYFSTDAYLRPTNTDGDAFSIHEALYLGVPVLTSDAVPRPEGCLIFRNRDVEHFAKRMKFLIDNYDEVKIATKRVKITGNEKELLEFFSDIGDKNNEKEVNGKDKQVLR